MPTPSGADPRDFFLVHPPVYQPTEPPPGIPYLMASLRAAGHDATVIDLNLRLFERLLTREVIGGCLDLARRRLAALDAGASLDANALLAYLPLLEHASLDELPGAIEDAVDTLRSPRFYDPQAYLRATRDIKHALGLVSATLVPFELRFDGLGSPFHDFDSSPALFAAIDRFCALEDNVVVQILESELDAHFGDAAPRMVGISLTYPAQLFFGMLVARSVRRRFPDTFLLLGGPLAASLGRRAHSVGKYPLFREADAIGIGDCETLICDVAARVLADLPLEPRNNLLLYDRASGTASLPDVVVEESLDALPTPDFSDFALPRYWVPTPVLPLPIARGCYWDKCTFCHYGFVPGGRRATAPYRQCSVEKIVADMTALRDLHGCRHFDFTVDLVAPKLLDQLARALAERRLDLRWGLETRAEVYFTEERCRNLHAGGMTYAEFGLESMDQSVLDAIHKGTVVEQYADVLGNFTRAGIATSAMGFFDFPGEDLEGARRSIRFLRQHADQISEICWGSFALDVDSQVYKNPERFGIDSIEHLEQDDLAQSVSFTFRREQKTPDERALVEAELEELIEEGGFGTALGRPFAGGGSGEAHSFLYYAHLGVDAVKQLCRAALQLRTPALTERSRLQAIARPRPVRFDLEELCSHVAELREQLSSDKGRVLRQLGHRRSPEQVLERWDAEHRLAPAAAQSFAAATPGNVAMLHGDVAGAFEPGTGSRTAEELISHIPRDEETARGVLAELVAMGFLRVVA